MTTAKPRSPGRLSATDLDLVVGARRGVLVTVGKEGLPRPVPFCYVARLDETGRLVLHSPIDDKPKRTDDLLSVARVLDIASRPEVVVLVDRWNEDWTSLAWVRLYGSATTLEAGESDTEGERAGAIAALRIKYPQYAIHALEERPLIRIVVHSSTGWNGRP